MRKCTKCQKNYPESLKHFLKDKRFKGNLTRWCRNCSNEYQRAWSKKHPRKSKERQRKYDNSEKRAYLRLKQSSRALLVTITQEDFIMWYKSQPRKCCYCGIEEARLPIDSDSYNRRTARLTIDRMNSQKGYEKGNLALCCYRCNSIKGNFFTPSEMVEIGQKYISKRWEDGDKH